MDDRARLDQRLTQMKADKARRPGDQYSAVAQRITELFAPCHFQVFQGARPSAHS